MTARSLFTVGLRLWAVLGLLGLGQNVVVTISRFGSGLPGDVSPLAVVTPWVGVVAQAGLFLGVLLLARSLANWFYGRRKTTPDEDEPLRIENADLLGLGVQFLGFYTLLFATSGVRDLLTELLTDFSPSSWGIGGMSVYTTLLQTVLYALLGSAMIVIPGSLRQQRAARGGPPPPRPDYSLHQ